MKIYNSLSREKERLDLVGRRVGMYTCGPTVYNYVSIGNWRTYALGDMLVRTLEYLGNEVKYVMNITDVGHLTGDNLGDADKGEDRMLKAARRERMTAWEVAERYTKDFLDGFEKLGFRYPDVFCKATDHIEEQIKMIQRIEEAGYSYRITDGIYFDVAKYEAEGHAYGELSNIDRVKVGARVEPNPEKRDPRDFALWKFNQSGEKRYMEWESPWGVGFPGWHIECSAMSTKYLGDQFDIHVGGEDLRSTHHPNEIAQAEAATGKQPFVKYWVHGAFLLVDGGRMGKSLGNAYTLHDIEEKGFSPLDLKYFYLTGHYRKQLNFTWEALAAAANARKKLVKLLSQLDVTSFGANSTIQDHPYRRKFVAALKDDLNIPRALAILWEVARSEIDESTKIQLLAGFDEVFGLGLVAGVERMSRNEIPAEVQELVARRSKARKAGDFEAADELRAKVQELGYELEDEGENTVVRPAH